MLIDLKSVYVVESLVHIKLYGFIVGVILVLAFGD